MSEAFHLIDLVSQAHAVQTLLAGKSDAEKLEWLACRGKLELLPNEFPDEKQGYRFESQIGTEVIFFFHSGKFIFVGDHTTFTARED
jgi:hypothetical protein